MYYSNGMIKFYCSRIGGERKSGLVGERGERVYVNGGEYIVVYGNGKEFFFLFVWIWRL